MQPHSDYQFEICSNSVESCLQAQKGGADRVELCCALEEGGLTPSYATIKEARQLTDLKIHVLIRPRSGDFHYSENELKVMAEDIRQAVFLGADGIVIGCLTEDGDVDVKAMQKLLETADGKPVTFHRAFDCCRDARKTVQELIRLKVDRILTSGQQPSAEKGIPLLRELQKEYGDQIIFLAGCGVNESNISRIHKETGIREFHFSAREKKPTGMKYFNRDVYMGTPDSDDYSFDVTSAEKVRNTIDKLTESRPS